MRGGVYGASGACGGVRSVIGADSGVYARCGAGGGGCLRPFTVVVRVDVYGNGLCFLVRGLIRAGYGF